MDEIGAFSVPGSFKLDYLPPLKTLLSWKIYNLSHIDTGHQLALPGQVSHIDIYMSMLGQVGQNLPSQAKLLKMAIRRALQPICPNQQTEVAPWPRSQIIHQLA